MDVDERYEVPIKNILLYVFCKVELNKICRHKSQYNKSGIMMKISRIIKFLSN